MLQFDPNNVELKTLQIGQESNIAFCGTASDFASRYPQLLDEYQPMEYPNCGSCSSKCTKLKRIGYSKQILGCCLGTTKTGTCDPNNIIGNLSCDSVMRSYCKGDNINDPKCRSWAILNPGSMDQEAAQYCKANPQDKFCSCAPVDTSLLGENMSANAVLLLQNPMCFSSNCQTYGYKSAAQIASRLQLGSCPAVCINEIVNTDSAFTSLYGVQQNCGSDSKQEPPQQSQFGIFYILLILFVIIITLIIARYIYVKFVVKNRT